MSSGDFEAELRASVQDHLALIASAAQAAKARIGAGVESARPAAISAFADDRPPDNVPVPPVRSAPAVPRSSSVVNFDASEPDFDPAFAGAFEDVGASTGDEGIPVWEDPP